MRYGIFLFALMFGTSVFAQAAPYRGVAEVEEILTERMTGYDHPFNFYRYIGTLGPNSYLLRTLLGAYSERGGEHLFENGRPNSVSMLLWNMVLHDLSKDLEANCKQSL